MSCGSGWKAEDKDELDPESGPSIAFLEAPWYGETAGTGLKIQGVWAVGVLLPGPLLCHLGYSHVPSACCLVRKFR